MVVKFRRMHAGLPVALMAAAVAGAVLFTSCSASDAGSSPTESSVADDAAGLAGAPGGEVGAIEPVALEPGTAEPVTTAPETTAPETTMPETSQPVETSSAPTTLAATTSTTTAPTTTAPPTTTDPPAPLNRVPMAPTETPLAAVGTQSGGETARVQQRLLDLGFWLTAADGEYGLTTRQAVMAFQKYLRLLSTGEVDANTAALMSNLDLRAHGLADSGTLVEVDKARQLLMFVVDGRTRWVFNTSTGDGEEYIEEDQNTPDLIVEGVSLTPDGFHEVNRERPEGWWEGDLGQIYRPKYFVGGVAVHGSNSVPNYPASHGCVRVTVEAMDFIWENGLMPMRLPVWVHEQTVV